MSPTRFPLWRDRAVRLWLAGGASIVGGIGSVVRNKWFALHLETAGLGVLGQVFAGQTWLGTATSAGLGLPVAKLIGEAVGRGDVSAERRTVSTALAVLSTTSLTVAIVGLLAAPWISAALLGSTQHAALVRISMLAVAGIAFQPTVLGLFAGHSDVRSTFVYALIGNAAMVALAFALVPRFGLAGAVWSVAALWVAAITGTLWLARGAYAPSFVAPEGPRFDRAIGGAMLKVASASLVLGLLDQGTLLALRAHYVRQHGLSANGLMQAALGLAQQLGGVFYGYLAGYAFGKITGVGGPQEIRDYTRKHFGAVTGLALVAFGVAMTVAGPVLRLFYSNRFEPARPMVAWMMTGEFAKVVIQTWALGALPLGGVRLWIPIGVSWPVGMAIAYLGARALGVTTLSLPIAYAGAGALSLAYAAWMMSGRRIVPRARDVVMVVAGFLALAALSWSFGH
jgi:O-antigen/teichoic acid export membrane protein